MSVETYYRAKDFHKVPWDKLEYSEHKGSGHNFSFGKGGTFYLNGNGWQLSIYSGKNDLVVETYELPRALSDMMERQHQLGKDDNRIEIKRALGL